MDDKNRHLSEEEILEITKKCMNKTFGDLGLTTVDTKNKGGLGGFVEENVFEYAANSDDNPDFIDAGIELKVTPLKKNENGQIVSKERLVLNMINYVEEGDKTFETSSFYRKNKRLLIWFYLYLKGKNPIDYQITNYDLFEFEKSLEYKVIKKDWEIIHKKIASGKADKISESDTTFLSACRKGSKSSKPRKQFKDLGPDALPRAYSFKNGYMTRLYRRIIHEMGPYVSFISEDEWMKNPLEEVYKEKFSIYKGMAIQDLRHKFYVTTNAKDHLYILTLKMMGVDNKKETTQELADTGIKIKTVHLRNNGTPHESMSFPAFDFSELLNTTWEESEIRDMFVDWKLMFVIFQDDENGVCRFDRVEFWNIPNSLVDKEIKQLYEKCVEIVKSGNVVQSYDPIKDEAVDNFPKESKQRDGNGVCHVRPHGLKRIDTFDLPVPDKLTGWTKYSKQCFWFNKLFIKKIIKEISEPQIDKEIDF